MEIQDFEPVNNPKCPPRPRPPLLRDITGLCRLHSEEAFKSLVTLMRKSEDENIRLKAAESILNRAYGKPSQSVLVGEMDETVKKVLQIEFVNGNDNNSA